MEKHLKVIGSIFLLILFMLIGGCSVTAEETSIVIEFDNFVGTNEKEFKLNDYDNQLNMGGTVELSSGIVYLSIVGTSSEEELYSYTVTPEDCGKIKIDISDLKDQRNLIFKLTSEVAKDFSIKLNSDQKLVLDKVTPEPSTKPEK